MPGHSMKKKVKSGMMGMKRGGKVKKGMKVKGCTTVIGIYL